MQSVSRQRKAALGEMKFRFLFAYQFFVFCFSLSCSSHVFMSFLFFSALCFAPGLFYSHTSLLFRSISRSPYCSTFHFPATFLLPLPFRFSFFSAFPSPVASSLVSSLFNLPLDGVVVVGSIAHPAESDRAVIISASLPLCSPSYPATFGTPL